jgi:hypothetical protein
LALYPTWALLFDKEVRHFFHQRAVP